jgi:hypothetical protein
LLWAEKRKVLRIVANSDTTLLYTKLSHLPENLKSEVSDFIDFLLNKMRRKMLNQNLVVLKECSR